MIDKKTIISALEELRKDKKRKFSQSVDLIINLKNFDTKKESLNTFITLQKKFRDSKIIGILEKKSEIIDTITSLQLEKLKDRKEIKKIAKEYDFFIASAKLMPKVASVLGRFLGPLGKMPSPQLGVILDESDETIKKTIEKLEKSIRIRTKEPSIKVCVGKESMTNEDIADNIITIENSLTKLLPRGTENIRNILIKFTMTKPVKIQ